MIQVLKHEAQSIKAFPSNENIDRELHLLLPPSYADESQKRYPVIFFLSGWGSKSWKYLESSSSFGLSLRDELQTQMREKKIPEAILAFPDGSIRLGSSQYINSPSYGNFMDYISEELVELIDQNFRSIPSASSRAIIGHSSGGFGALMMGMHKSNQFSVIASSAGDCFFEASILPGLISCLSEIERSGSLEKFIHYFVNHPNPGGLGHKSFHAMYTLSLAACYAPRPTAQPLYGELFFELHSGKIKASVWEEYLSWDPIRKMQKYKDQLSQLKMIFLDCGNQDEYGAQWGNRQIAEQLKKWNLPHELIEYSGRHSGNSWRLIERCAQVLEHLETEA